MRNFLTKLSIRIRLILIMVITALCAVIIGALLLIHYDYGRIREQLERETNIVTGVMAQDFAKVLLYDRQDVASDVVMKLSEFPMVLRVDLFDMSGALRFRYAIDKNDSEKLPESSLPVMKQRKMYVRHPVIVQGTRLGEAGFVISTSRLLSLLRKMYFFLAVYIPFSTLVIIAAAIYLQRYFSEPLLQLTKAITQVTETQDYSLRLNEEDRSEFGILCQGFNRMLQTINITRTKLNYRASHDSLTGLKNRYAFERRLAELVDHCREDGQESVFVYMDLDQFKVVNDTCGHLAGDALLRQLAALLSSRVRSGDCLARLGGDEFGLLLDHCPMSKACAIVEDILAAINEFRFKWDGQVFKIGVSIGLVTINSPDDDIVSLFRDVDAACYAAKEGGRGQYYIFNKQDKQLSRQKSDMAQISVISRAIDEDRFVLYAQPICALVHGDTHVHHEILLRMRGGDGTILSPGSFLPGAERYGLIEQIDRWVVEHLIETMVSQPSLVREDEFFSVNLSAITIGRGDFLPFLKSQFVKHTDIAEKICVEITETAAIGNLQSVLKLMAALKALGVRFALDDFGTGMSSFSYLKTLPVDYVKIDGQFVRGVHEDKVDYAMVRSINEIAHIMGIKTIAEFVENGEIVFHLERMGVDYGQGYHLGRPVPLTELYIN